MSVFTEKQVLNTPNVVSLAVYALTAMLLLAAVSMFAYTLNANTSIEPVPMNTDAHFAPSGARLDDARLFAFATGRPDFTDDRLWYGLPGAEAALSAVYLGNKGGIEVWDIDTATGNGTLVIRVGASAVTTALLEAKATNTPVLLGTGLFSTLYAMPWGQCQINSFYPDGKPYSYVFDC